MKKYKLGKRRASYNPKKLWIGKYINKSVISVPATLPLNMSVDATGNYSYIMTAMMANGPDPLAPAAIAPFGIGDCFWAASVRRAALAALSVGKVLFTSEQDMVNAALDGYASTGWKIAQTDAHGNNPTDNGTDPTQGFAWLQNTGLLCSDGTRDKISSAIAVNPADFEELIIAFNLSAGNMMIGIAFPEAWEDAAIWDETTSPIDGGHEIPAYSDLSLTPIGIQIDTWGNAAPGPRIITPAGLNQQADQVTAIIALDSFGPGGTTIAGFDSEQMLADIQATQVTP